MPETDESTPPCRERRIQRVFSHLKQGCRRRICLAWPRREAYHEPNVSPMVEAKCAFGADGWIRPRCGPGERIRTAARLRAAAERRAHDGALVVVWSVGRSEEH